MNDVVSQMKLKEERHTEPVEYDYFSPALMDCWPKIISFITGPQDLQALMNSCGLFYDLVEPRIFAELITPVLLHKNRFLGKEGLLKFRQLNPEFKSAVDSTLLVSSFQNWTRKHVESSEEIEEIMNNAKLKPNATPFMFRAVEIYNTTFEDMRSAVGLFKAYGHRLDDIDLYLPNEFEAGPLMAVLIEAFGHLKQLQKLCLMFCGKFDEGDEDRTMIEPIAPSSMPRLEKLSELTLLVFPYDDDDEDYTDDEYYEGYMDDEDYDGYTDDDDDSEDYIEDEDDTSDEEAVEIVEVTPLAPIYQSFLQAYGKQVTSFSSNNFIYTLGLGVDFFNNYLPNVEHYRVYDFDGIVASKHGILSEVSWPNLKSLDLFSGGQTLTPAALQVFKNFRASLNNISFGKIFCYDPNLIILETQNLPNVKEITLSISNIGEPIMLNGLPTLFPNLEYIKFLPSFSDLNRPNPGLNVRNQYFDSYPKLKTFVWSHCDAYSQWIDNEFTRGSTLPSSRVCFTKHCS